MAVPSATRVPGRSDKNTMNIRTQRRPSLPLHKVSRILHFSVTQAPGSASLAETADTTSTGETGDEHDQTDLGEESNRIPSPVYEDMPPIPEVTEFQTKTDRTYYGQLTSENANQVNLMRRIIREEGELTKGELKQELKERRDVNIFGSFDADLRVL